MSEQEKTTPQELCEGGCEACPGCPAAEVTEREGTVTVADVSFRDGGKVYFFDPGELKPKPGDHVMIETARGPEFGVCQAGSHPVPARDVVPPLRKILRMATAQDEKTYEENRKKEKHAYQVCLERIEDRKLEMQLVSAEYAFDGSKILFFFTAEGRVDFRELVKDLAAVFHTRIELRQIGVRDKAKMVGGLGICGRPFCCREFLDDFEPVSIKMAKTQNLSLNPTKISGTCGRLMCCLKYEQEAYEELIKTVPKADSFVDTPDGRGTVTDVNLLRQTVRVRMERSPDTFGTYGTDEIYVIRNGKAKKTDPPIPEDFAPISSQPRRLLKQEEEMPDVVLIRDQKTAAEQEPAPQEGGKSRRHRRKPASKPQEPAAEPRTEKSSEEQPTKTQNHNRGSRRRRPRRRRPGGDGAAAPHVES